jgi:hypothetical protein
MTLDLTREETTLILWALIHSAPDAQALRSIDPLLDKLYVARGTLHLPLEPHGTKGADLPRQQAGHDEQLRSGVSDGRPQGDHQSQRTAEVQAVDRWSSGKRDGFETLEAVFSKVERKDLEDQTTRLTVTYENPAGRGFLRASVWDEKLFPWISARVKQKTVFYVTRKGQYINIVGVRA